MEYFGHKYLLHGHENIPENPTPEDLGKAFKKHQLHHAFINQRYRMASNLYKIAILGTGYWCLLSLFDGDFAIRSVMGMLTG